MPLRADSVCAVLSVGLDLWNGYRWQGYSAPSHRPVATATLTVEKLTALKP